MRHVDIGESGRAFVEKVRRLEERLFSDNLEPYCPDDMKNEGRNYMHFRPSHHFETGLVTEEDVENLRRPTARLLSIGAFPPFLERTLIELGIPATNIVIADEEPAILQADIPCKKVLLNVKGDWPDIGTFDRIIFPESLGVATDMSTNASGKQIFLTDPKFPEVLSIVKDYDAVELSIFMKVIKEVSKRLRPEGIMRANGPSAHPHVIGAMHLALRELGYNHIIEYWDYFLSIKKTANVTANHMLETFGRRYRKMLGHD